MPNRLWLAVTGVLLVGTASPSTAGDWPAFRGPNGDGTCEETGLAVEWSRTKNVLWRSELPAPGNSSPIVAAGKVFITVAEDRGRKRHLLCFDRRNGEQLWSQTIRLDVTPPTHKTNPYSGSSPVTDGNRVVVYHGSGGMFCYDLDGKQQWSAELGEIKHIWGFGSSPILHDGKVIQLVGPGEDTRLVALKLESGEIEWETPEPGGSNSDGGRYIGTWATPLATRIDGRDQLLMGLPTRVGSFDPQTGKLLWWVDGLASDRSDLCYTSPIAVGDVGVLMGGFGGPSIGFQLGGEGDVTESNRLWRNFTLPKRLPQRIGTGVVVDGLIYMANADGPGSFQCIDPRTGESRWTEPRTEDGPHWGSMISADGRLYVTGQKGITRVLAPNPDRYEVLAANDLGEPSNSTPAVSDGDVFLRTAAALYCIRNVD